MATPEPGNEAQAAAEHSQDRLDVVSPPTISLPKGGGAIRGIGEKFTSNPVTGTGSMSVPIMTSAGRSDFGPKLQLSYDSGAGNSPFGFGWSLSLPSITRKTNKGLPQYYDTVDSDTFLLSDAEDLVPEYRRNADGNLTLNATSRSVEDKSYIVRRYRPRIEGLFARIERWTNVDDPQDVHWRSISRDNVLTIYGKDSASRIYNPDNPRQIFSWLICETRDDKGNGILYDYKSDDGVGVDLSQVHERNRGNIDDPRRKVNRYIKRICYGNQTPLLVDGRRPAFLDTEQIADTHWMFEVVFDYGEHDNVSPHPDDAGHWTFRRDPFSRYGSGFEVRTTRLCQRVLMFHHFPFPDEAVGTNCLVRSTDFTYSHEQEVSSVRNAVYTFLQSVTHWGYKQSNGTYLKRSLPPIEFKYSHAAVQDHIEIVDSESIENLPIGLDGTLYQWTDLHGEGIPGMLTEQGGTWHYKRNLSPINKVEENNVLRTKAKFAPIELVASKPNAYLSSGAQFMDLAGDGQPDLVLLDGHTPGFYEHDRFESWQAFRPFASQIIRNMHDPNLKFVDLTGDGHADVLITGDDVFVWHSSLGEMGFSTAQRVLQALDEERGPRLVFADGTQSIFLTDFSGDGLTDLARIRNGEVCYWPNLGYGRFGAKVTMDNAPKFSHPDQFDHKRLRLADIDGSGTADIIYLHHDGVRLYFNQSGNSWSEPEILEVFPAAHNLANIQPIDLLGNGTACLVWSSSLPSDKHSPMRYVNLMGGQKPHLLIGVRNNLGSETEIQYAPSTKFYLQDKQAGTPWITRLPFPVHVVEKVTVKDKWRDTSFSQTYSYHHGYFDGVEREFRGFGRVERTDTEYYGAFAARNTESPYITDDHSLYQPPVKTVTWFHTGAFIDRHRILSQFEHEYFPNWFERQIPDTANVLGDFSENTLPEPDIVPSDLSTDEWREALRACKGMMLRQETYELDVDALKIGEERPVKLFTSAYHNCHIRMLQPKADNQHAVFMVTESEAITYHYEIDLDTGTITADPRIAHNLNLRIDDYGNVLQSVAVVYPRIGNHKDERLDDDTHDKIADVQSETHISYTETHYTEDIDEDNDYRLRVPCEVQTYELTGISPQDDLYFTQDKLQKLWLSPTYQSEGKTVDEIGYHQLPDRTMRQKRLVEYVRMLFFDIDANLELNHPLPLGQINHLGLPYETYKLALTNDLLDAILGDRLAFLRERDETLEEMRGRILSEGGYHFHDGAWWIRSGIAGFASDAAEHFFLPERYTDPFGNTTTLEYDGTYDLFIQSSTDPLGNRIQVSRFNYRVLAPEEMEDINGNVSEVKFDTLGMPVATALKGKGTDGDSLESVAEDVDLDDLIRLFSDEYDETQMTNQIRNWLDNATARHVYYFGEKVNDEGNITYGHHPSCAVGIVREQHVSQLGDDEHSPLQIAFEYSDGSGNVLVKKVQAEPESGTEHLRWIATGKTILNNKGKPVKQYEPYFSIEESGAPNYRFEEPHEVGVTPIMYYDSVGRLIRTEFPDGTFSRVEFSPWHVTTFDPNDTVKDSTWYTDRDPTLPELGLPRNNNGHFSVSHEQRAAWLAAHHHNTPATTILDSLGREVITIAHNRVQSDTGIHIHGGQRYEDAKYVTFTKLDTEGKPLWIRDDRDNMVMQYITPPAPNNQANDPATFVPCYDIAGNLLFQHSMDAGDRWMLMDSTGESYYAWDENEVDGGTTWQTRIYHTTRDELRRPLELRLSVDGGTSWNVIERYEYRNPTTGKPDTREHDEEAARLNLGGQVYKRYDSAGLVTNQAFDFKGNLLQAARRFIHDYAAEIIDWGVGNPEDGLNDEIFTQRTQYDALNRMTYHENWHLDRRNPAIYLPQYNERGLLVSESLSVNATASDAIERIEYNAKGQRTLIRFGNGTITRYHYDEQTFRLMQLRTTRSGFDPPFPQDENAFHSNLNHPDVLQQLNYTYDPSGNITEINDEAYEPVFFRNQEVRPQNYYIYDPLYRLIEATGREQYGAPAIPQQKPSAPDEITFPVDNPRDPNALRNYRQIYRYDPVGNIVQMTHVANRGNMTRHYRYAADSNRLERTWTGSDETQAVVYDYDTHGNMLNLNRVPEEYRLKWDYRDMIHTVNLGTDGQATYTYCSDKQRRYKRVQHGSIVKERFYLDGMEWYRHWEGDTLVEEIETHHLFLDDQRILIVEDVRTSGTPRLPEAVLFRYQYSNHLGSVGLELTGDSRPEIISYEEYHPYGTTAYHATNEHIQRTAKRYRYTGMERDEETGLSYHTARYYMPWLGRWCSTDPIGIEGGINLYLHVDANPVNKLDVSGKQPDEIDAITSADPGSRVVHPNNVIQLEEIVIEGRIEEDPVPTLHIPGPTIGAANPAAIPIDPREQVIRSLATRRGFMMEQEIEELHQIHRRQIREVERALLEAEAEMSQAEIAIGAGGGAPILLSTGPLSLALANAFRQDFNRFREIRNQAEWIVGQRTYQQHIRAQEGNFLANQGRAIHQIMTLLYMRNRSEFNFDWRPSMRPGRGRGPLSEFGGIDFRAEESGSTFGVEISSVSGASGHLTRERNRIREEGRTYSAWGLLTYRTGTQRYGSRPRTTRGRETLLRERVRILRNELNNLRNASRSTRRHRSEARRSRLMRTLREL